LTSVCFEYITGLFWPFVYTVLDKMNEFSTSPSPYRFTVRIKAIYRNVTP